MSGSRFPAFLKEGLAAGWPICLGYIPIGMAFGVLAQKAGLSAFQVGIMSLFVFAGSSQFIAVGLLASGATLVTIVATTFVVNFRHFLMSSALAPFLSRVGRGGLALFSYGVTDESFAVNYTRFVKGGWDLRRALTVNHAANSTWIASTLAGALVGEQIPVGAFGVDYALYAMFIGLLLMQLRNRACLAGAVVAGLAASGICLFLEGNFHVIIGAVAGATAAFFLDREPEKEDQGGGQ